jgi:transposase-like protein
MYLWHAGGREGEILDTLVQLWTNMAAALRLLRKLPKKQGYAPQALMTDKLRSCAVARRELHTTRCEQGLHKNNRAENSERVVRR